MIWTEELSASLDQSGGVVVFHRIEVSRAQQLAQVIADKVGSMVEQSEKTLDIKMGGTGGWGDRADGNKGEKRGEQTQERRGRGERRGGGARGILVFFSFCPCSDGQIYRSHAWTRWTIRSRSWKSDAGLLVVSVVHTCSFPLLYFAQRNSVSTVHEEAIFIFHFNCHQSRAFERKSAFRHIFGSRLSSLHHHGPQNCRKVA